MTEGSIPPLKLVVWGMPHTGKTTLMDGLFHSLDSYKPWLRAITRDDEASKLFHDLGKDHYVWEMSVPRLTDRPRHNLNPRGSKEFYPFRFHLEVFETTDPNDAILSSDTSYGSQDARMIFLALDPTLFAEAGGMIGQAKLPEAAPQPMRVEPAAALPAAKTAPPPASQAAALPPAQPVSEDDVDLSEFVPLTYFFREDASLSGEKAPGEAQPGETPAGEQSGQPAEAGLPAQVPDAPAPSAEAIENPAMPGLETTFAAMELAGISSSEYARQVKTVWARAYSNRQNVLVFITKCDRLAPSLRQAPLMDLLKAVFGEEMGSVLREIYDRNDRMVFVPPGEAMNIQKTGAPGGMMGHRFPSGGLGPVYRMLNSFVGRYDWYHREIPPFQQEAR